MKNQYDVAKRYDIKKDECISILATLTQYSLVALSLCRWMDENVCVYVGSRVFVSCQRFSCVLLFFFSSLSSHQSNLLIMNNFESMAEPIIAK